MDLTDLGSAAILPALLTAVIAYFCGCFNGAVIVSKYILRDDVRTHGSGNAGLTNFYRTFGGPLTLVVILTDVFKAIVAIWVGMFLFRQMIANEVLVVALSKYWAGLSVCSATCSPACSTSRAARAFSPAAPSPS